MSDKKELHEYTDEELLSEAKRTKPYKTYDSVIIGFFVGVAIWSTIRNGFGLLTFLPLIYLPAAAQNRKRREAIETIMEERGLDAI